MFLRVFLLVSGVFSFLYFLNPQFFDGVRGQSGEVLGINKINADVNKPTIETALTTYCLSEGTLPGDLNQLFGNYLDKKIKIDLRDLYDYKVINEKKCEYSLDVY